MDAERSIPPDSQSRSLALEFVYKMYQISLEQPLSILFQLTKNSCPGFPYVHMGFPTKGAALNSNLHLKLLQELPDPVALSSPKGSEALPDEDLAAGKLRTVCITPAYFISLQKFYFESQNVHMKLNHSNTWGKYGYVKQYGGYHRLMKKLEPFHWLFDLDISGWDRKVYLRDTYELRTRGLKSYYSTDSKMLSEFSTPRFGWVIENCQHPIVGMHDGSIWRRRTGNNSGSNNTTTDNTLQHSVICMHFVIDRFLCCYDRYPSYEEATSCCTFLLFGDDNAGGLPLDFATNAEELKTLLISHYAQYGLTVKLTACNILFHKPNTPFSGISFLGSTAQYKEDRYVPYPRLSKIAYSLTSIMHCQDDTADLAVDKLVSIWDLISDCDLPALKDSVSCFADFVYKLPDISPCKKDQLDFARHKRVNWSLYQGFECRSDFSNFCPTSGRRYKNDTLMAASSELGSRVPRKAKAILDKLVASKSITQEGMEWLITATDPFHDDRVRCPGFPDMSTVNSVVQTFTSTASYQISGATQPWDLHCFFVPMSNSFVNPTGGTFNPGVASPNQYSVRGYFRNTSSLSGIFPGFNVLTSTVAGDDWIAPSGTIVNSNALALPPKYCSGHYRLITAGVESVNTTAQLYKGGSVTVYRAPSTRDRDVTLSYATTTSTALTTSTQTVPVTRDRRLSGVPEEPLATTLQLKLTLPAICLPPTSQKEAATYTDSRTWAAEDGCYVIATQNDEDNPFLTPSPTDVAIMKTLDASTILNDSTSPILVPIWTTSTNAPFATSSGATTEATGSGQKVFPFDNCGFVMSGLNQNSTIQITVRYYVERIPATSEPDLLAMAQVPPAYDGVAMEIYSRCLASMPVGVPVSENPLGEWFNSVLDTIKGIAPKLGGVISGVGRAISEIGGSGPPPVQSNATPLNQQTNKQKARNRQNAPRSGPKTRAQILREMERAAMRKASKRARGGNL